MLLGKNLRSILYYVIGVSAVCLVIEISKRNSGQFYNTHGLYEIRTAVPGSLEKSPEIENSYGDKADNDIIPKRNRGRENSEKWKENEVSNKQRQGEIEDGIDDGQVLWGNNRQSRNKKERKNKANRLKGKFASKNKGRTDIEENLDQNKKDTDTTDDIEIIEESTTEETSKNELETKNNNDIAMELDGEEEEEENDEYEDETYNRPDPDHSCSAFSITDEHATRNKQVQEACKRIEEQEGQQRRMYSRLRWAIPQRLLYCPVFKAASSSWLINYLKLSNHSNDNPKEGNLHKKITDLFPPPTKFRLRKKIYDESLKFMVARHPFERLVSAYRDKLAGFTRNAHYIDMRKRIITRHRKQKKEASKIPTFHEAVDFVLEELEKLENGTGKIYIDGHFMPYTRRCLPCAMNYDIIVKFETIDEDSKYIIKQCHLEDKIKVQHDNYAPTGALTRDGIKNKSKKVKQGKAKPKLDDNRMFLSLDFFKDIPMNKIKQLYNYYRHDFEIFGYTADEYMNL